MACVGRVAVNLEVKAQFFRENNLPNGPVPERLQMQWRSALSRHDLLNIPPQARQYKSTIIGWLAYWPFSAVWTLINDPVKHISKII